MHRHYSDKAKHNHLEEVLEEVGAAVKEAMRRRMTTSPIATYNS
jgi:hypothetical protein